MKCVRCGTEINPEDKFCLGCGFEMGKEYNEETKNETLEDIMEFQTEKKMDEAELIEIDECLLVDDKINKLCELINASEVH